MKDSKKIYWAIESGIFPHVERDLVKLLENNVIVFEDELDKDFGDDQVVFLGSLELYERYSGIYYPGPIGNIKNFYYDKYYLHFAELLLNSPQFTTISEFLENKPNLPKVFVKPNSPLKPFSGRVISVDDADLSSFDYGFYHEDKDLPIVVSNLKNVEAEWRLIIIDGLIITGCRYSEDREAVDNYVPLGALRLGEAITYSWQPAFAYVADIGLCEGEYKLLELNPFSGADFYSCYIDRIVTSISTYLRRI